MIRSFHYAVHAALLAQGERGMMTPENRAGLAAWGTYWQSWVSATYLGAYRSTLGTSLLLPSRRSELEVLLRAYLLDKVVYEIGYELNHRPAWLEIPFAGILQLMKPE